MCVGGVLGVLGGGGEGAPAEVFKKLFLNLVLCMCIHFADHF